MRGLVRLGLVVLAAVATSACRDLSRFASHGDRFEGAVVKGSFVRAGVVENAAMCVTLDAGHLQDAPGTITTSDGRFHDTPLRPIPQIWHDPLSTLSFGDGRIQNLIYVAAPMGDAGDAQDIVVIVSLVETDHVEVRLLRGAPQLPRPVGQSAAASGGPQADASAPPPGGAPAIFGVFNLNRLPGPCSF